MSNMNRKPPSKQRQFDPCMKGAFEILLLARQAHEEARGAVSPSPRVDKYQDSSKYYEQAAFCFAECYKSSLDPIDKKRAEAWQHYCLAMKHGDRANGRRYNPAADRQNIADDSAAAMSFIAHAQEVMPWGEVEQREEQVRWKILEHSFAGLLYKSKGQKIQQEGKYKEAAEEYLIAAEAHSKAGTLAESLGDQATYQRAMGRAWAATSTAYECRASMSKGKEREEYLIKAENATRQALEFRPYWSTLQQMFTEIILKQEQLDKEKNSRKAWILTLIGFLLGLVADLILRLLS
jgi:hypothetical protein